MKESRPATPGAVTLIDVLVDFAALDTAGCEHHANGALTFGQQSSILTMPADVCAVFSLPGRDNHVPHRDRHYLIAMHKHAA